MTGRNSELATSPLPTQGPKGAPNGYITLAFSGLPMLGTGRNSTMAGSSLPCGGTKVGKMAG